MNDREFLRHAVATVAYRAAKALRGAPPSFAGFRAGPSSRTPAEILAHMGDLFDWAHTMAIGQARWNDSTPLEWDAECARFFAAVRVFDEDLMPERAVAYDLGRLFQGPVADALTHTGQIAMLRRMHGDPVRGESYNNAAIQAGRVGAEQTPPDPRFEFE